MGGLSFGLSSLNLLNMFLSIPAILIAFTVKEYVRARVAYKLGDKAQKLQGRLTLDPLAHIDIYGFILIVVTGFGWSKPAQVNKYAFKNQKKDSIKVTLAAMFSQLIVAFIAALVSAFLMAFAVETNNTGEIMQIITAVCWAIFTINTGLFVFNLIPIPGLEMFNLLVDLKPAIAYKIAEFTGRYNIFILLGIILFGSRLLSLPANIISGFINNLAMFIVRIFM